MRAGRGFTAVARQVPRLAGLVRLPVWWLVQTAIRRRASWLAIKASVILISRWPFALQKYPSCTEISNPQGVRMPHADCGEMQAFIRLPCETVNWQETIYPARGKYAQRHLRGNRAAIGSGGKKARPF